MAACNGCNDSGGKNRLRRRELKERVRNVHASTFGDLRPEDGAIRADRLRSLCPCEYRWEVPLWDIISEAYADPSPLVRREALHVIEDAWDHGVDTRRAMRLLYAGQADPDPSVAAYARELVRDSIPRRQAAHRREHAVKRQSRQRGAEEV